MTGSRTDGEKMTRVDNVAALFQGVEDEYFNVLARDDQDEDSDSNADSIESLEPAILEEESSSTHSDWDSESTYTNELPPQPSSSNTQTAKTAASTCERTCGSFLNLSKFTRDEIELGWIVSAALSEPEQDYMILRKLSVIMERGSFCYCLRA